jgi:hypothetical protein
VLRREAAPPNEQKGIFRLPSRYLLRWIGRNLRRKILPQYARVADKKTNAIRKSMMTTASRLRPLSWRAALAALAIAATAALPAVAFAEAIHPTKTTVSADPDDNWDYTVVTGDGGGGGGGG